MPSLDPPSLKWPVRIWFSITSELNFYRIHLIYLYVSNLIACFACWPSLISSTVIPLIFSAIFYASNGRYHVAFIDALFNCFSSMCVCGLVTVNLSSLTKWQQVILFIQMQIGHPVSIDFSLKVVIGLDRFFEIFVSWFMVLVRRSVGYYLESLKLIVGGQALFCA